MGRANDRQLFKKMFGPENRMNNEVTICNFRYGDQHFCRQWLCQKNGPACETRHR